MLRGVRITLAKHLGEVAEPPRSVGHRLVSRVRVPDRGADDCSKSGEEIELARGEPPRCDGAANRERTPNGTVPAKRHRGVHSRVQALGALWNAAADELVAGAVGRGEDRLARIV